MQKKLVVLFLIVLLIFAGLSAQLYLITRDSGEEYKQKVLSQQEYDSTTIPFKRGNIVDSNGTILAVSNKVYNVILDTKVLLDKEENVEPVLEALHKCFGIDTAEVRNYIAQNPGPGWTFCCGSPTGRRYPLRTWRCLRRTGSSTGSRWYRCRRT